MTKREQFFFDHAWYSYDLAKETPEQGKERCAKDLAAAEEFAKNLGWEYLWEIEQENPRDVFGEPDPVNGPFYDPENEFWQCALFGTMPEVCPLCAGDPCYCYCRYSAKRKVLGSLGMIEAPTPEYRRVVEAELASEAMTEYLRSAEVAK
jgi:hypothetical protein